MDPMVVKKFMLFVIRGFRNIRCRGFDRWKFDHAVLDKLVKDGLDGFTQGIILSSSMSFRLTFRDNHMLWGRQIVVR